MTQKASAGNFLEQSHHRTTESFPGKYLIWKGQHQNPLISLNQEGLGFSQFHMEDVLTLFHSSARDLTKRRVLPGCFHSRRGGACSITSEKCGMRPVSFGEENPGRETKAVRKPQLPLKNPKLIPVSNLCSNQPLLVTPKGVFCGSASL